MLSRIKKDSIKDINYRAEKKEIGITHKQCLTGIFKPQDRELVGCADNFSGSFSL